MTKLLKKGLEIELYGGFETGEIIPLSSKIVEQLPDCSQEPDQRNFEYITNPTTSYENLFVEIIEPRIKIRNFLKTLDTKLTLIPHSTIPLPFSKDFYHSKPGEPYHEYILNTYKTNVITTSIHINIGIDNHEDLFKLLFLLRLDMPLFLALSASSCFHDGRLTEYDSYRWHSFPKTPDVVPFFTDHNHYINWTNEQLKTKKMQNVRHLWTSIRPNGPNRPYELNRIEVRICDLVTDTKMLIAIVTMLECLIQKYLITNNWPSIIKNHSQENLVKICNEQEELAAKKSLDAQIWDWRNDTTTTAYKIIEPLYTDLTEIAKKINVTKHLQPINDILHNGNEARHFLKMHKKTNSIEHTMQHFIDQFTIMDLKYHEMIKSRSL